MSLRRRVLVAFVLVAAVLVVSNATLASTFHSFLLDRLDRQLVSTAATIANRPPSRGDRSRCLGGGAEAQEVLTEYFIACGPASAAILHRVTSPLREDDPVLDREALLQTLPSAGARAEPYSAKSESGDATWRLVAMRDRSGNRVFVVGVTLDQLGETLARIRAVQLTTTVVVLLALAVVAWWMVRLGIQPIEAMAATADGIAAGDLSRRVEHTDERTEVGRLGTAFNTMIDRIEEAFRSREASEARVRRFAADASHELRTPLTSIRGYAELWRAGGLRDKGELAEAMRRMEQEATRMGWLVDDLLLLARLDQRRPLDRSPVRLDVLAADAVQDARAIEPNRRIDLSTEPVTVDGDDARLRQVLANLLANVRLHTPQTAAAHVRVGQDGEYALVEVADEGPGMPPEVASKVFERFFRADPARARAAGGTGLGLSIVAAIAEAHGGTATVSSDLGRGSRFVVALPAPAPAAVVAQGP